MSGRRLAQLFCLVAGAGLFLEGVYGFAAVGSSLGTPGQGWHNIVHLVSGAGLVTLSRRPASARAAAIGFGTFYLSIALAGLIDGEDVAGLIPAGPVDVSLHALLGAVSLAAGAATRAAEPARA
ncbi:MAG TPA: DUF4383 domain-containing protein [Thermoleophilaceae bacterium]